MPDFDVVLFDFDGTIADTSPGIKEGLSHVFALNNMRQMTDEETDRFIGPPLDDSFVKYCSVTREKAAQMVLDFRAHYHNKAIDKFYIYDGIEEAVKILKEKNITVGVATSKPEVMARHILEKAGISDLFDVIQGATLDGKLIKKKDIVRCILDKDSISGKKVLMVGDTEFDILGAHENNLPALWVEYGFGTLENALAAKPEYIAHNMGEMIDFFQTFDRRKI